MHTLNKWVLMAALLHGAWAAQAQEWMPLELEAEQRSISRLSVAQCLDTVQQKPPRAKATSSAMTRQPANS